MELCYKDNVIFLPGDIFYENTQNELENFNNSDTEFTNFKGKDTFRIGFGRLSDEDIKKETSSNTQNIKSGYYIANDLSFIAPFLVSSLIEKGNDDWTISLWKTLINKPITQCTFYENTLNLMAMIVASGNWY